MKFTEIETKYSANDIVLSVFEDFCKARKPVEFVMAAGYDHFYDHKTDENTFCRLRTGPDAHQLTFKRKTNDKNNFVRTEHNIDLARSVTKDQIEALLNEFGYKHNVSIYKNCFVYIYEWYTLVYYVVYDLDMKEQGRFVEIEMKESAPWESENAAWNELLILEKLCKAIGISPQSRIKRSLFELFRK